MPIFHEALIELRRSDRVDLKPRKEPIRPIWWVIGCAVPIALFSAFVCGCDHANAQTIIPYSHTETAPQAQSHNCKDNVQLDGMTIPIEEMQASPDGNVWCEYESKDLYYNVRIWLVHPGYK